MSEWIPMRCALLLSASLWLSGCAGNTLRSPPPGFWDTWGDGQAEVSVYRLSQNRYGELRQGVAVQILVTETFSASGRVKADPGRHAPSDLVPVLKLNALKRFRTGIYDYSMMTSAFVPVQQVNESPLKITFSSQEWCGQVFDEAQFTERWVTVNQHSYFDGEGTRTERRRLPSPTYTADTLPIRVRELLGPSLAPGQTRTIAYLPPLAWSRLQHTPWHVETASITRSATPVPLVLEQQTYQTWEWKITPETSPASTFSVEVEAPHRLLRWTTSAGESAELIAVRRLKYWELNKEGDEAILRDLGLDPDSSRWPDGPLKDGPLKDDSTKDDSLKDDALKDAPSSPPLPGETK